MSETLQPVGVQPSEGSPWWRVPLRFSIHIFAGTAIFGVLALAAVGLAFLTAWVKTLTFASQPIAGPLLINGLIVGEYAVFGIDLLLFLVFLGKTASRMFKEL